MSKKLNNLGLTEEQVSSLLCEEDIYENDEAEKPIWECVSRKKKVI